jgi:hypothetical protein
MGFSRKDSVLVAQAQNFSTVLTADPLVYGESAATATAVAAAVDAYVDSLNILSEARANGVRSQQQTAARDADRLAMLNLLRPIYAAVQDSVSISNEAKIALGVLVKDTTPTPQPIPDFAPLLSVTKVDGNLVQIRAANPNDPASRARPPFTAGIAIFSHVGPEAPTDPAAMKFEGNTGRIDIAVTFAASVPTGSSVWFVAQFFNNRKQAGPPCMPVGATLGAGSVMPPPTALNAAA